jgi:hypothetical protein
MRDERGRHIMTAEVLSIDIRESITEAMRLFASYPVHHLPVVDDTGVIGILSSADMLKLEHFLPKSGRQLPDAVNSWCRPQSSPSRTTGFGRPIWR